MAECQTNAFGDIVWWGVSRPSSRPPARPPSLIWGESVEEKRPGGEPTSVFVHNGQTEKLRERKKEKKKTSLRCDCETALIKTMFNKVDLIAALYLILKWYIWWNRLDVASSQYLF